MGYKERLASLKSVAKGFEGLEAQAGWFPEAKYDDGTPVAYVMNIHEYGAPAVGIPPRPFFRQAISSYQATWNKNLRDGVKAAISGKVSPENVLTAVGLQAAGDIKMELVGVSSPPLSKVTLLLRKWKKEGRVINRSVVQEARHAIANGADYSGVPTDPLNDTGYAIATLTSIVVKK